MYLRFIIFTCAISLSCHRVCSFRSFLSIQLFSPQYFMALTSPFALHTTVRPLDYATVYRFHFMILCYTRLHSIAFYDYCLMLLRLLILWKIFNKSVISFLVQ